MKENIIRNKSFNFAISIINLYKFLIEKREFVISKQLLKSGTSIGANVEEANAALTKKEFISKMSIASKEARETRYWLLLLQETQLVKNNFEKQLKEIQEIIKILTSIIKTSQANLK